MSIGQNRAEYNQMNSDLIKDLANIPSVKVLICILLVILTVMIIMRILGMRSLFRDKGIAAEINNVDAIKKRDKEIIRANNILKRITKLVNNTGLSIGSNKYEYMEYNIHRAGLKVPGGFRDITPDEFNALVKIALLINTAVSLIVTVFISGIFGITLMAAGFALISTLPMLTLRSIVSSKDDEIKENFFDLYLMLHYTLVDGAQTPIAQLMRSYGKQTTSEEMLRFVDTCTDIIDTYGEYNGSLKIAKEYREIAVVGKLMRIIRQSQDGGDVVQELLGFKSQLMKDREYEVEKRMNKLVLKAETSFKILTLVLIQAIISAMMIYFPDIASVTSFF